MKLRRSKLLLAGIFTLFISFLSISVFAEEGPKEEKKLKAGDILMEHILDAHEFHFLTIGETEVSIPLPVILYAPGKGFSCFMSSKFEHGHASYQGYKILNEEYLEHLSEEGVDLKKAGLSAGKLVAVDANDQIDATAKFYDFSMTRNVTQMILSLILLVVIMTSVAKKYRVNGANKAPSGFQNAIEPVIIFVRDQVGKSTLGNKYEKYMPYLLTVFFFILINNIVGLIPGTANVTGNIAFTAVLGVISFIVITFSSNKHYWMHIINPPGVPGWVKIILVPVEILGIFTKPFALIIRLFANMVAGHMIITCLILLIFIFGSLNTAMGYGFSPVSIAFAVFIYFIEILVAFLQAFIFTMLTGTFIGQAFEGGHDDAHH